MYLDYLLRKDRRGSFLVSDLPQVVAFWAVALRKVRLLFVVCKGQMVKKSKLRTTLGRDVVCWDEPVSVQFV